jgi:hypothetical protein
MFAASVQRGAQVRYQKVITVAFHQLRDIESAAAGALGTVNLENLNDGGQVSERLASHSASVLRLQTLVLSTLWQPICTLREGLLSRP